MRMTTPIPVLLLLALLAGCGAPPGFEPIDPAAAVFWDRQSTESGALLRQIAAEFNAQYDGIPIKIERTGGYGDIFRKVSASIQARRLPSMAVSYESMTSEYLRTGAVAALDPFLQDPETGFTQAELADFFPVVLETNTFPEFGGKMYSFPFAKSVLMLFFNKSVLGQAGIAAPPRSWDQFIEQCRAVKNATGKPAYALSVDCSTVSAMIYSKGGELVRGRQTRYDAPESIEVFELIETLAKEKLAYQITPGSFDDNMAFARDQVAFTLRTSASREPIAMLKQGDMESWGIAPLPQANPERPATVLFGPNITLFNTTPDQQRAAWAFVKYFTATPVSARWALGTGYLPIRKSAADHPDVQAAWGEWEYNRAAYDSLAFARPEPNIRGWQQVRDLVERAETEVLSGIKTAREAALDLKRAADQVLARQ